MTLLEPDAQFQRTTSLAGLGSATRSSSCPVAVGNLLDVHRHISFGEGVLSFSQLGDFENTGAIEQRPSRPIVVGVLNPRNIGARTPRQKSAFFGVAIDPKVQILFAVAHIVEPRIEHRGTCLLVFPRTVHNPEMGVAEFVHIRRHPSVVRRCPMVFDANKHAVSLGDVVAAQPHVHPRKGGQSRGFCDGESGSRRPWLSRRRHSVPRAQRVLHAKR